MQNVSHSAFQGIEPERCEGQIQLSFLRPRKPRRERPLRFPCLPGRSHLRRGGDKEGTLAAYRRLQHPSLPPPSWAGREAPSRRESRRLPQKRNSCARVDLDPAQGENHFLDFNAVISV